MDTVLTRPSAVALVQLRTHSAFLCSYPHTSSPSHLLFPPPHCPTLFLLAGNAAHIGTFSVGCAEYPTELVLQCLALITLFSCHPRKLYLNKTNPTKQNPNPSHKSNPPPNTSVDMSCKGPCKLKNAQRGLMGLMEGCKGRVLWVVTT